MVHLCVALATGKRMRSVALDEAHEMLVNKDLKTRIVRPSKEYLDRMLYHYPVRSMVLNVVKNTLIQVTPRVIKLVCLMLPYIL